MDDFGTLIEGLFVLALGSFMVFAPKHADRLNKLVPYIRTGGTLKVPFGIMLIVIGVTIIVVWCSNYFA